MCETRVLMRIRATWANTLPTMLRREWSLQSLQNPLFLYKVIWRFACLEECNLVPSRGKEDHPVVVAGLVFCTLGARVEFHHSRKTLPQKTVDGFAKLFHGWRGF